MDVMIAPELPQATWPTDTDILFPSGSNRLALRNQRPLLRVVIQDAIEHVRAELLCQNAFPDPALTLETIRTCLRTAASRYPGAASIHRRLMGDEEYMMKITPLVSSPLVETMLLTLLIATRSDSTFPKRSQRAVCCYRRSRFFGHQPGSNQISRFNATIKV